MNDVTVTKHAVDRAVERLGLPKGEARISIQNAMKVAKYIGTIIDDTGRERRIYAHQRVAYSLALDEDVVITVYRRNHAPNKLSSAVNKAIESVLVSADRKLNRKSTAIERMKAELRIEIGTLELRRMRTKSEARRLALTARINALNEHFAILDGDIAEVKRENSALRKGVVAYV